MDPERDPHRDPQPDPQRDRLRGALLAVMADPAPSGERVEALALEILQRQARENPTYGALLRARGLEGDALVHWTAFPAVPVRGFRGNPPFIGPEDAVEATFRTSGTTRGGGRQEHGVHRVRDLALYKASLLAQGGRFLNPDGARLRALGLLPDPGTRPDSSLVHMAGVFASAWGDGGGGFFADAEWRLDGTGMAQALHEAVDEGVPVLLMATAFALVHWMDGTDLRVTLPEGSRILETGGFKGRSRVVERGALYAALEHRFGVPQRRIVNEYGMTEMLSQFWEPVLVEGGPAEPAGRRLVAPPWVQTRMLDPVDLSPVPPGEVGLLCHLDLANLDSAALLLTEDLGVQVASPFEGGRAGFRVLGRVEGATPRGCSLAIEQWMEAGR